MIRRSQIVALAGLGVVIVGLGILGITPELGRHPARRSAPSTVAVTDALGSRAPGFARATAPRTFQFPADHGPHPEFRTEWWYFTGNVSTAAQRRFGYQLTFFRIGLAPPADPRPSAWATRTVWMAHLAVTDIASGRFLTQSRLAREALGLAGAQATPLRVWLEDWTVVALSDSATPPVRLTAADADIALDFTLESVKAPVLQGERGLSRKGPSPGNASYYYSLTRLETRGSLRVGGDRFDVVGTSWMDREWSTSALEPGQVGWDWFALALEDGRELMVYRLRRADGSVDPFSAGSLVGRDGVVKPLGIGDLTIEVLDHWSSRTDGTRYPSRWRVSVPSERLTIEIEPRLGDQEWIEPVRYWEGAVVAHGSVSGEGYVELVGYASERRRLPTSVR